MNVYMNAKDLREVVAKMRKLESPAKSSTARVEIRAEGSQLILSLISANGAAIFTIPAIVKHWGTASLHWGEFSNAVKTCKSGRVTIASAVIGGGVTIDNERGERTQVGTAYLCKRPVISDRAKSFTVPARDLRRALGQVIPAMQTDYFHVILNGVLFELENDTARLTAADGYVVSETAVKIENPHNLPAAFVLPFKAARTLYAALRGETGTVTVRAGGVVYLPTHEGGDNVYKYTAPPAWSFAAESFTIEAEGIGGVYPDITTVFNEIARQTAANYIVDRKTSKAAFKTAFKAAKANAKTDSAWWQLTATIKGGVFTFAPYGGTADLLDGAKLVDARLMARFLDTMAGDKLAIVWTDKHDQPIMARGENDYRAAVMPVSVRGI